MKRRATEQVRNNFMILLCADADIGNKIFSDALSGWIGLCWLMKNLTIRLRSWLSSSFSCLDYITTVCLVVSHLCLLCNKI